MICDFGYRTDMFTLCQTMCLLKSRGDQIENAQYFVDKGYAEQLQEDQLTLETFNETIQEMLKQSQVYHQAMEKSTELLSLDDFYGLLQKDISKGKDDGRQ